MKKIVVVILLLAFVSATHIKVDPATLIPHFFKSEAAFAPIPKVNDT